MKLQRIINGQLTTFAVILSSVANSSASAQVQLDTSLIAKGTTGSQPTVSEDDKLVASDGSSSERFGDSAAISGTTAIVGAPGGILFDLGITTGVIYLYDTTTGIESFKLIASDARDLDLFGASVAIAGTTAVVGAPQTDQGIAEFDPGFVYIFDTTTGQELFRLMASDAGDGDEFGAAVAISGSTIIVGAPGHLGNGSVSGAVYLFDATSGQQLAKYTALAAGSNDRFGASVAISGSTILVGAPGRVEAGSNTGAAYFIDTINGQQIKVTAFDGSAGDEFGISVAMTDTTAIIGASGNDVAAFDGGSVYLFDTNTQQAVDPFRIIPADVGQFDQFGASVTIEGTTAIIGSPMDSQLAGSAYAYNISTGEQIQKLIPADNEVGDEFGKSVAMSGATIIAGAPANDGNGPFSRTGAAYVYSISEIGPCPADLNGDGALNFFDVSAFLQLFGAHDPEADFTNDGIFNFFDVSAFLQAFSAGCP